MSEAGEKILDLLRKALPQMSEAEKERFLWFSEGVFATVEAQGAVQDSAQEAG